MGIDIMTVFTFIFQPQKRKRLQNESMGLFAVNLASGVPLLQTLDISRKSMPWQPYRMAMNALYSALGKGQPLIEALKMQECRSLPTFVLVIMASDLTDVEKGNLLRLRYAKAESEIPFLAGSLGYPLVELMIAIQTCFALVMFVLPQFKEIFTGLHVELPFLTQILLNVSDFMVNWWFIVMPVLLFIVITGFILCGKPVVKRIFRRLAGIHHLDFVEILRILAEIPPDDIDRVLGTISLPVIMPYSSDMVGDFKAALGSGQPVDQMLARHHFDPQVAWMIRLGLEGKGTRENFSLAADLIEARVTGTLNRSIILINTLAPLLVGTFVGFITISVFLPMVNLLERI
ncbi:MAG TPA: type II secretion system F family protein [Candidatus Ozemobacteraceae bacterium]|nr:type II secretion system F family protein [Candidatus Ozemobacteraceae bacterium]